ncbi:MAG: thioesterase family protein [Pseudomonadota bacterium]
MRPSRGDLHTGKPMGVVYTDLMAGLASASDGGFALTIPDSWMQGRSTYGGLSAAIGLKAAEASFPNLPPLRSMQVSFIGPVGGDITIKTELLRQGRSVTFVGADIYGEKGLGARSVFAFGQARPSLFNERHLPAPQASAPDDALLLQKHEGLAKFAYNFSTYIAGGGVPFSDSKDIESVYWVRHNDDQANDMAALIALADMPPPALSARFPEFAPISSMTWHVNVLTDAPHTDDGLWLMRVFAEDAKDGYSSQDMTMWSKAGELTMTMRQSVAIFV